MGKRNRIKNKKNRWETQTKGFTSSKSKRKTTGFTSNKGQLELYNKGSKVMETGVKVVRSYPDHTNSTTSSYEGYTAAATKPPKKPIAESVKASIEKSAISHSFEELTDDRKNAHIVVARNGVFEVRENEIGTFMAQLFGSETTSPEILGLKSFPFKSYEAKLPKIPVSLLQQTIKFFMDVCDKKNNAEAGIQIFWNREKEEYFIAVNDQEVSGASVTFERDPGLEEKELLIMDIHSHNTMDAFWSGTDDADEKETRLYGVIGKLNTCTPTMRVRASCAGHFIDLEIGDIFDNKDAYVAYPPEWMEKVKEKTYHYSAGYVNKWAGGKGWNPRAHDSWDDYDYGYQSSYGYDVYGHGYPEDVYDDVASKPTDQTSTIPANELDTLYKDADEYDADPYGKEYLEERASDDAMDVRDIADNIRDLKPHQIRYLSELLEDEGIIQELYDHYNGRSW